VSVELYRVDDRLIHGQVVLGWAQPLNVRFIMLVDDAVAASQWEMDLYRMGVPEEIELIFAGVDDACERLADLAADRRRGIVLTADVETMISLHECSPLFRDVNIGGMHTAPGRSPCLRYVYMSDAEEEHLRSLSARGVRITAQDLPSCAPVPLDEILRRRKAL
jgi:PTS system mannose-specific IIB component/fructoselysine and glucoselysine-specific PTS system IIB component